MYTAYITLPESRVLARDETRQFTDILTAWKWLKTRAKQLGDTSFSMPGLPLCVTGTREGFIYGVERKGEE